MTPLKIKNMHLNLEDILFVDSLCIIVQKSPEKK